LDLNDCGPTNFEGDGFILVTIDKFRSVGWIVPLENKNAQAINDSSENILSRSKI